MTKICISIVANSVPGFIEDIKKAKEKTDFVELRLDYIKNIDKTKITSIINECSVDYIFTCRPKKYGGNYEGDKINRFRLLKHAINLGASYIDIEYGCSKEDIFNLIKNKKNTKIILSHHDFDKTPSLKELNKIYDDMSSYNPDLIKIVTYANSINDNFKIFNLLKEKKNLISFTMGIRGHISRILTAKYESMFTYASLYKGKESADGQICADDLEKTYNFSMINKKTKILGVLGEHAQNSKSKFMHNANFKDKKLNFVYMPFKVRPNELENLVNNFKKFNFRGGAVTVPHKENIMKFLDNIDETAQKIGATNTFVNNDNILTGYNTDYYGAEHALKEITEIYKKKVLILGAGGAAKAICYVLHKESADFTIINRTLKRAEKLSIEFGGKAMPIENIKEELQKNEIIINTTSVGMNPNPNDCLIDEEIFPEKKFVMDIVYNPSKTILIKRAKQKNCIIITGDRMLAYQAIGQFKKWTGVQPDFNLMQKALMENL